MRCPHCGAPVADGSATCSECGADLTTIDIDATVDELMGQLPTVRAQRIEEQTRMLMDQTRLLDKDGAGADDEPGDDQEDDADDATRLMNGETRLMDDKTKLVNEKTRVQGAGAGQAAGQNGVQPNFGNQVPGIVPVDSTVLRPRAKQADDDHLIVRNTRDYDHDAQSSNTVSNTDNFETITEKKSKRDVRRDPYAKARKKGRTPGEGNSTSKLRPLLALLIIAIVLGGGGAVLTYGMELWGGKTIPSLVGESQGNAENSLAEKGFVVRVEAQPADDAIGKVLSQSPEAGQRVPEGTEVTIVIATNRTMPDVVGLSEADARAVLQEAGAELVETQSRPSSEPEGTVLETSLAAGQPFVSRQSITLVVAGPFIVPDVIDDTEEGAKASIQAAGLTPEIVYVASEKTVRTVVQTNPGPGEPVAEGSVVQVMVSSPYPSSPLHLAEYFGHSSQDADAYLQREGYGFVNGFIDANGNALAVYQSNENGKVTFSSQPYIRSISLPQQDSSNVLATGVPIAGMRFDLPVWQVPEAHDRAAVEALAQAFGFDGLADFCDNTSITLPAGTHPSAAQFSCASGKMGDLAWTVVIVDEGGNRRASATCTKEGLYGSSDVSKFGGSVCRFVAYQEVYTQAETKVNVGKRDINGQQNQQGQQ